MCGVNMINFNLILRDVVSFNEGNFVKNYDKKVFSIKSEVVAKVDKQSFKIKLNKTTDSALKNYSIMTIQVNDSKSKKANKVKLLVKNKDLNAYIKGDTLEMSGQDWMKALTKLQETSQKEGARAKEVIEQKKHFHPSTIQKKVDGETEELSLGKEISSTVDKASKAIFLMGATAAGKGVVREMIVTSHAHRAYVIIDPDLIKESMIEYQQALKKQDMSAATQVHEESVKKANEALKEAIQEGKNFIYDSTGSRDEIYKEHMNAAKERGMVVELVYVVAKVEICLLRAKQRGLKTGRFIPEQNIKSSHTLAQENFESFKKLAHKWKKYGNEGMSPIMESVSRSSKDDQPMFNLSS